MTPGEYLLRDEPIEINAGRATARSEVTTRGERPIQVGAHCHFFEVNRELDFDRARAYGMRLNIAAGTAVRFEPGDTRAIDLVALGGARHVSGLNRLVEGSLDDPDVHRRALEAVRSFTKKHKQRNNVEN